LTPAVQSTSEGRPSGMRVREKPKRFLPRRFLCKGTREPVSAPALVYAAICFLVTAAFFAVFFGAASGLAAVGFVVSAFFVAGFFLGW
jgi:hypothetical protein